VNRDGGPVETVQSEGEDDPDDDENQTEVHTEIETRGIGPAHRGPASSSPQKWKRVLVKLSGEAFAPVSGNGRGIDPGVVEGYAQQLGSLQAEGIEIAVVVGGGNLWRGLSDAAVGMDRVTADYMGMLATVMNALALHDALERTGVATRVQSAISMQEIAEPFIRRRALHHLEKGRVVIFAGGTGNPYFTTDTTAALRAAEIGAEVVFKATNVDGVYNADPKKVPDARKLSKISFTEVLHRDLKVMDAAAIALCRDNAIPIVVFDLTCDGNLRSAVRGENIGTRVVEGRES